MTRLFAHRHGKFTGSATTVCAYGDQLLCAAARRHAQFVLMARLATPDGQPFGEVFIKRVSIFWSRRDAGQHALTSQTPACVLVRTILSVAQTTALENSQ